MIKTDYIRKIFSSYCFVVIALAYGCASEMEKASVAEEIAVKEDEGDEAEEVETSAAEDEQEAEQEIEAIVKTTTIEEEERAVAPEDIYIIKRGDTLWGISKIVYGVNRRWPELAAINQLKDPNKIYPDHVLAIR